MKSAFVGRLPIAVVPHKVIELYPPPHHRTSSKVAGDSIQSKRHEWSTFRRCRFFWLDSRTSRQHFWDPFSGHETGHLCKRR
ncbi:hypothetical protein GQ602_004992 [Ophiocordyceps camponoti-floridani]|uniref:Uncharacterized protein n=1 Tax=Ophiocordyceps camponoti-floridani TaxID=2030778 RepID=A0A8H4Q4V5_9HYPO|nr:hypothetical protein GQ602_004992 [Ophiocordyceps camponoti-floridani]